MFVSSHVWLISAFTMLLSSAALPAYGNSGKAKQNREGFAFTFVQEVGGGFLSYNGENIYFLSVGDDGRRSEVAIANKMLKLDFTVEYASNKVTEVWMAPRKGRNCSYKVRADWLQTGYFEKMVEYPDPRGGASVFTLRYEPSAMPVPSRSLSKIDLSWVNAVVQDGFPETNTVGDTSIIMKGLGSTNCVVAVEGKLTFATMALSHDLCKYIMFKDGVPYYASDRTFQRSSDLRSAYTLYGSGKGGIDPSVTYFDDDGDGLLKRYYDHKSSQSGKISYMKE